MQSLVLIKAVKTPRKILAQFTGERSWVEGLGMPNFGKRDKMCQALEEMYNKQLIPR